MKHIIASLDLNLLAKKMIDEIKKDLDLPNKVILERFSILEELVYGNVLRNHSKFRLDDMDWVRDYDFIIVYCRPEDELIYNFGDREQMAGVIEEKEKLVEAWDNLIIDLARMGFVIIPYDWTKMNLDSITKMIGEK